MKEQEVERVLSTYGESLGRCERRPLPRQRRSIARPLALVAAGLTVAAITFVAMKPVDAVAATLQRVGLAIKNAKTMEVSSYMLRKNTAWQEYCHIYYKDGMWATRASKLTNLQVHVTQRDGKLLTNYSTLGHATIKPAVDGERLFTTIDGNELDALEFVKQYIDSGSVSVDRQAKIVEHVPVKGRQTYMIVFDRPEDRYHAELIVDKATNLPISTEISVTYQFHSGSDDIRFRHDYAFNQSISDELFTLKPGKPVIDLQQAEAELNRKWSKPVATVNECSVRDACVTEDGVIWIATTSKTDHNQAKVLAGALTIRNGEEYILAQDIIPAAILGPTHRATIAGETIVVSLYLPRRGRFIPTEATLSFAHRRGKWAGFSYEAEEPTPAGAPISLKLRKEKGDRPFYFSWLELDHFGFQLNIVKTNAVAEWLEAKKAWLDAAAAYEECARAYEGFVKYAGYQPLRKAATCYEKAGLSEKAVAVRERADRLKASRER
jgi:outer membrane lipoprotein-sorting protein